MATIIQTMAFLPALADDLEGIGAKFDICDTMTAETREDLR
jgi:hypothetical protein